jgi:RNA recognition motif. (a.k.a. RRM, RBD, or RNP domain)
MWMETAYRRHLLAPMVRQLNVLMAPLATVNIGAGRARITAGWLAGSKRFRRCVVYCKGKLLYTLSLYKCGPIKLILFSAKAKTLSRVIIAHRKALHRMATKLFLGKLSYDTTDDSLRERFAQFGTVISATVIRDRDTNQSKGFGFVEMESAEAAQAAINALDGKELDGRTIVVNVARPREDNRSGGGFGFRGGNNSQRR